MLQDEGVSYLAPFLIIVPVKNVISCQRVIVVASRCRRLIVVQDVSRPYKLFEQAFVNGFLSVELRLFVARSLGVVPNLSRLGIRDVAKHVCHLEGLERLYHYQLCHDLVVILVVVFLVAQLIEAFLNVADIGESVVIVVPYRLCAYLVVAPCVGY